MSNLITRSFSCTSFDAVIYSRDSKSINYEHKIISGAFKDTDSLMKYLAKHNRNILDVDNIKIIDSLYGMTVTDFVRYGQKFDARSKETRELITKQIENKIYTVRVYDKVRKNVIDTDVTAKDEKQIVKNLPSNYTLLEVVSCEITSSIYGMEEKTFIEHARPMIDHYHFVE